MMISANMYVEQLKNATYKELIQAREELIESINAYEKKEQEGDRSGKEWCICPTPDVQYQCHLEYLSALCSYMQEKYNNEYVWGDKKLSDK